MAPDEDGDDEQDRGTGADAALDMISPQAPALLDGGGAPRSRICLACRTLFDAGQDCPGKKHQTVSLVSTKGRDLLDDEVWGPDSRARALRQAARAGAGGATLGGVFKGCDAGGLSGCDAGGCDASGEAIVGVLAVIVVMAVVAVLSVVIWWLVKLIVNAIRNAMDRPKPHGALLEPPKPKKMAVAGKGVVRSGKPLTTPWKPGKAFAYAMELYEKAVLGGGAMLRDARSAGFEVLLDDGRILRVPAGRVRILGKRERVESDSDRLDEFLEVVDPGRSSASRSLFPYEFARAVTIGPGDRVDVLGDVEMSADAGGAGYRANAGFVSPVGVPVLRVHRAAAPQQSGVRVDASLSAKAYEAEPPNEEEDETSEPADETAQAQQEQESSRQGRRQ